MENQTSPSTSPCTSCQLPLDGQFVRALGGCYHMNCFKCQDCGQVVASRFFPMTVDGKQVPLCEKDYFGRHDLLCAKCNQALRGSYITALNRKYHLEHFTCSQCETVFGPDETYFEHSGQVYCHFHYSGRFASRCGGCGLSILKQFVEVKGDSNVDQWHPECYMIYKSWNVRMLSKDAPLELPSADEDLKLMERIMEEKVNRIWTVLSAFEESAAACISDMLLHVSNQAFVDAVSEAGNFIVHVDVLFSGIDALEAEFRKQEDSIGLAYNKEPKMLAKKIVNFFSLLSHTQDSGTRQYGTVTQELLSLVTSLAQYLKVLIRIALAGALKLEHQFGSTMAIGSFLNKLIEVGEEQQESNDNGDIQFDSRYKIAETDVKSDLCMVCRTSVEEECFRFNILRWHKRCMQCSVCQKDLGKLIEAGEKMAFYDVLENHALCDDHKTASSQSGFEQVTQLQQYTFLLRVALKRLYSLLKIKDDSFMSSSQIHLIKESPVSSEMDLVQSLAQSPSSQSQYYGQQREEVVVGQSEVQNRRVSFLVPSPSDIGNFQEDDLPPAADNTKKDDIPLINAMSQHNLIEEFSGTAPVAIPLKNSQSSHNLSTSLPDDHAVGPVGRAQRDSQDQFPGLSQPTSRPVQVVEMKPQNAVSSVVPSPQSPAMGGRITYLAELSALETFIVRHIAVLKMQPFVKDQYSVGDLVDLLRERKASFWTKIISSLNPVKKPVKPREGGTFGISLEMAVEKFGVETKLGTGTSRCRIPIFVDNVISALKAMDMGIEGIFRKNGNIKNLSQLQDLVDKNPSYDLSGENPIQIGALLKKYLRELPEPLLTFKLYRLFILSQKLPNQEHKKKMLQYIVCLLPKANRDLFEVLLVFLRDVSKFTQNKMDMSNLATVFTPNILYAKVSKQAAGVALSVGQKEKEESMFAIETIKSLMSLQDSLWVVPVDIQEALQSNNELLVDDQITSKDVIRKFENMKKTQVSSQQPSSQTNVSPHEAGHSVIVEKSAEESNSSDHKPRSGGQ